MNGTREAEQDVLTTAIQRGRALLAFAAGKGLSVPNEIVLVIITAHDLSQKGPLTADQEVAFWAGLGKLAQIATPVTPESLEDTDSALENRGFFRSLATRWIASVSLIVIVATLSCQIYWVILVSRIESYKTAETQLMSVARTPPTSTPTTEVTATKEDAQMALAVAAELLGKMILVASKLPPTLAEMTGARGKAVVEEAQNIADILYKLVLPALYGLLGSIIYALRIVSQQIQERSYTWSSRVAGIGRLLLGPVLGFASLVLVPSLPKNPTLDNLPPLAISLLAGYSVDLIFAFMDRIIQAFRPEKASRPT
jgi:hypothetical protein